MHLGYIYHPSPIVVPDGTPKPPDDTFGYQPTAFPGARAPHVWLAPERSILDLFGDGFVLLKFADAPTDAIERAAASRGVPLAVHRIEQCRGRCALRPARWCWCVPTAMSPGAAIDAPAIALALIDTVRGAGPRIAARRAPATSAFAP